MKVLKKIPLTSVFLRDRLFFIKQKVIKRRHVNRHHRTPSWVVEDLDPSEYNTTMSSDALNISTSSSKILEVPMLKIPLNNLNDCLVIFDRGQDVCIINETVTLTLIAGKLSLNGYQVEPEETVDFSVGLSPYNVILRIDDVTIDSTKLSFSLSRCLQKFNSDEKDRQSRILELMDAIKKYPSFPNVTIVRVKQWTSNPISWIRSVVVSPPKLYQQESIFSSLTSSSLSIKRFIEQNTFLKENNLIENIEKNSTVVVVGPSNSGKTCCLKQMINRLQNRQDRDFDSCLFIDLDPGQPEFGLPGTVSFLEIDLKEENFKPLISSSFVNGMQRKYKSIKSISTGAIEPSSSPDLYMRCVKQLLEDVKDYLNEKNYSIPIFVNTMGWIQGIGYLLTVDVLRLTWPTIVIDLKTNPSSVTTSKAEILDFDFQNICSSETWGWSTENLCEIDEFKYYKLFHDKCYKLKGKNRSLHQLSYFVSKNPEIIYKPLQLLKRFEVDVSKVCFNVIFPTGELPGHILISSLNFSWVQLLLIDDSSVDFEMHVNLKVIKDISTNYVLGAGILFVNEASDGKLHATVISPETDEVLERCNCIVRPSGLGVPQELHLQALQFF